MTAPLIGITTYHINEDNVVQIHAHYAEAVRRAGGIPLLIQPGEPRMDELLTVLDALILSGGGDVDPALYGQEAHEKNFWIIPERDQFEIDLIQQALPTDKPMLCICRGLQVLNVALGGSLIQHIPDGVEDPIDHSNTVMSSSVLHPVRVEPDSQLAAIIGQETVSIASWHHQAIDTLASGLSVSARASDGVIEAVEMPSRARVFGLQWHPEITAKDDPTQQAIFDALVGMVRK